MIPSDALCRPMPRDGRVLVSPGEFDGGTAAPLLDQRPHDAGGCARPA